MEREFVAIDDPRLLKAQEQRKKASALHLMNSHIYFPSTEGVSFEEVEAGLRVTLEDDEKYYRAFLNSAIPQTRKAARKYRRNRFPTVEDSFVRRIAPFASLHPDDLRAKVHRVAYHFVSPGVTSDLGAFHLSEGYAWVALGPPEVMDSTLVHEMFHACMGAYGEKVEGHRFEFAQWLGFNNLYEGFATEAECFVLGKGHDGKSVYPKELRDVQRALSKYSRSALYEWLFQDFDPTDSILRLPEPYFRQELLRRAPFQKLKLAS